MATSMNKLLTAMKKHPAIIPVFIITGIGCAMATGQILRSSNVYTDVSFRRKSNPHPWLNVNPDKNLKYIKAVDYSKVEQGQRPKY